MALCRIHITGGPGSGKTTAGRYLSEALGVPLLSLDYYWLDTNARLNEPRNGSIVTDAVAEHVRQLSQRDEWLTEGGFLDWTEPLMERAQLIIWMQAPWRVASYRIMTRHIRAELARNNRFPGWRRLYAFWRWAAHYYNDTNSPGLNPFGTPNTLGTLRTTLERYSDKVIACSSRAEVKSLARDLQAAPA
jgi:cytidylate kinase